MRGPRTSIALTLLWILAAAWALLAPLAIAQEHLWDRSDVELALSNPDLHHGELLYCLTDKETGGTFSAYPGRDGQGAAGELGPLQLCPCGMLPVYVRQTGESPHNPYAVYPWADNLIDQGGITNWPTRKLC